MMNDEERGYHVELEAVKYVKTFGIETSFLRVTKNATAMEKSLCFCWMGKVHGKLDKLQGTMLDGKSCCRRSTEMAGKFFGWI